MFNGRPPDGTTLEGARRHAKLIASYWEKRGLDVVVTVDQVAVPKSHGLSSVYAVRSNMVNGRPQKVR